MLTPFWLIYYIPYGTFTSLQRANKRKLSSDIMQLSGLAQKPGIDFIVFGGSAMRTHWRIIQTDTVKLFVSGSIVEIHSYSSL